MVHKYSPEYYQRCKEEIKEARRKFRKENKETLKEQKHRWYLNTKARYANIKPETLTYYGNGVCTCVRCGYSDLRALTLDHIIPIGREKRRVTGVQFYKILKGQGYPTGYQTLCANCQLIKMFEGNEWKLN